MQKIKRKLFISIMVAILTMAWALPASAGWQDTVKDTATKVYNTAKAKVTGNELTVEVNGSEVNFPDQEPFIDPDTDRTYVPLRFVSEALGGNVDWKGQEQIATVDRNGKHIEMKIGSKAPTVDGKKMSLDAPARLMNSRTVVPLRFVSEALGAKVEWIADTRTVVITDQGGTQQPQESQGLIGKTYTKNGYTIPEKNETGVYVETNNTDKEPGAYEISISYSVESYGSVSGDVEQHLKDTRFILESKFGEEADKIMNIIKQKKTRDDYFDQWLKIDGQEARVYSTKTSPYLYINIWAKGV